MSVRYNAEEAGRARGTLPAGFAIVRGGIVRPSDLVYSWTSNEWLRADSPEWLQAPAGPIADLIAVARPGVEARKPRETPKPALSAHTPPAPSAEQRSLF